MDYSSLWPPPWRAPKQTGITGRISDSTGGVIVSAVVTATESGGAKVSTVTNAQGIYQFAGIRAADYKLAI